MAGSLSDLAERGSSYDALTNLPGRPLFRDRLAQLIALQQNEAVNDDGRPTRGGATMFAVLLLDLNGFKAVNDCYGHHVGDQLLQQVARRLESCVRSVDLVARMSGDEFNVLLESIDPAEASQRAEQIAAALAAPYVVGEHTVISGASIRIGQQCIEAGDGGRLPARCRRRHVPGQKSVIGRVACFNEGCPRRLSARLSHDSLHSAPCGQDRA